MYKKVFKIVIFALLFICPKIIFGQCSASSTVSACNNNGSITLNYSGSALPPFNYTIISAPTDYINPGATTINSPSLTWYACNPGSYTIQISNGDGFLCSTTIVVNGTYTDPSQYNPWQVGVTGCVNNNNGEIHGVLTDGLAPYSYAIQSGTSHVGDSNSTGDFTGLLPGDYKVRAYDACGNFVTQNLTIQNYSFQVYNPDISSSSCTNFTLNSLTVDPVTPGGTYIIKNGSTVIASGSSLPLAFNSTTADIKSGSIISVCYKDACGYEECKPATSVSNDWVLNRPTYVEDCINGIQLTSVPITGTITSPYVITQTYNGVTYTVNSLPFYIPNTTSLSQDYISTSVTDACGATQAYNLDLQLYASANLSYTGCSLTNLNASNNGISNGSITYTLSPDPNGSGPNTSGSFPNLPDNDYTLTVTDACGKTGTKVVTISHEWHSWATSYTYCKVDTFATGVGIPTRSIGDITIYQYNGPMPINNSSTLLSTLIYPSSPTSNNLPSTGLWEAYNSAYFENTIPNQTTTYVLIDACGKTDTVSATNGPIGHQKSTYTTTVNTKCINKADVLASYTGDNPWESYYVSFWNINTPAILIGSWKYLGYGLTQSNVSLATDLPLGTYVIHYFSGNNCPSNDKYDTITIAPYKFPKITAGKLFACSGVNGSSVVIIPGFGIKPYQYRILNSVPSGTTFTTAWQTSNIFSLPTVENIVNIQIQDACGNSATKQFAIKPFGTPIIKSKAPNLAGCNYPLPYTLYLDSIFYPGATYQWFKVSGTGADSNLVISNNAKLNLQIPADTGTYSCRLIYNNGCIDKKSYSTVNPQLAFCLNTIGDRVWNDVNNNGIQDATEVGVAGITVTLYNQSGLPIGTTVTDAYGNYLFTNLPNGSYSVGFTLPIGYAFSPSINPGDNGNNKNSDANTLTGLTTLYSLANGETDTTVDAGIYQAPNVILASLGDKVWNDLNKNGIQDAGENGISGVKVTLYDANLKPIAYTTTDANGNYSFNNLNPGTYSVGFNLPATYVFSPKDATGASNNLNNDTDYLDSDVNPNTGITNSVILIAGENNPGIDAGMYLQDSTKGSLGDKVWNDVNNDGIQDPNETGVAGITVTLYGADGTTVIAKTVTDANGNYIFNNLPAGDYVVGFSNLPSGFNLVPQKAGSDSTKDSNPNVATGKTNVIHLLPGQVDLTIDAGIHNSSLPLGGLGDKVWYDVNNNGLQDVGEIGVSSVKVVLFNQSGIAIDSTYTDLQGNYAFNNLEAGQYFVVFSNLPIGYGFTQTLIGTNDSLDSNPDGFGSTGLVTVTNGQFNPTVDAGIIATDGGRKNSSLGDKVWYDINKDGIQNDFESGVAGVTVTLYANDGVTVIATTITDALGNYIFNNLAPGDYVVGFSNLPIGYSFTPKNKGTDSTLDANVDATTGGKTSVIHLGVNEQNLTIDAGLQSAVGKAGLGNLVWNDVNNNGLQDIGEEGVAGVTVSLYKIGNSNPIATTSTDANGLYQFMGLDPDTYYVGFTNLPSGYVFTSANTTGATSNVNAAVDYSDSDVDPTTGLTSTVTLSAGEYNPGIDAGIYTDRASLGNFVWNDANNNGIQDPNEVGVAGVTVNLFDGSNNLISTTVTDANGHYQFVNLIPGDYQVQFTGIPNGATFSPSLRGSDSTLDSDANTLTGFTSIITLDAGESNQTIDAGIHLPQNAGLGNFVWIDLNANGLQDANEPGLGGVTVTLYNSTGVAIMNSVTDANGFYTFTNLNPGVYSVGFSNLPKLYNNGILLTSYFTTEKVGSNDSLNSDVNKLTGITPQYTLNDGEYNPTLDAGIIYKQIAPLALENFTASTVNNTCNVKTVLVVENDDNVELYSLLRNNIVITTFKPLNSNVKHEYSYLDESVTEGVVNYKISTLYSDKHSSITNQTSINVNCSFNVVKVYPNPTKDIINIEVNSTVFTTYEMKLVDITGKTILKNTYDIKNGLNIINISLGTLSNGIYNLVLSSENGTKTIRVTKD